MPGSIAGQVTDWMKRLQQVAAELIMAHRWFGADAFDENVVRDQGAHDFDRCIDQVDECGRCREITMAVVDVWLQVLPELHTNDGMQLLKKHANDSMNE